MASILTQSDDYTVSPIDLSKVKLSQLRAFVAVATHKNFSAAAITLNVSQSSISHAIAALEDELGVVLFSRHRHGATLTYVGEDILASIQEILALLDTVAEKAVASRGAETGQVRIAAIRSLATHWLPLIISLFNQQYRQINITVTKYFDYRAVQAALQSSSADIGLMDIYTTDAYSVVDIGIDPYVLLLPVNELPPDQPATWEFVRRRSVIMPSPNDHGYDDLRDCVNNLTPSINVAYEINEDAVMVSMVEQGLGVALLPYLAALPIPDSVQVRSLPTPLTRRLAAVVREDVLHSAAVFLFLDVVKHHGANIFETKSFSSKTR